MQKLSQDNIFQQSGKWQVRGIPSPSIYTVHLKNTLILNAHLVLQRWTRRQDSALSPMHCCKYQNIHMSHLMTKPTKCLCTQRRLRSAWASAQSNQSSLCAQWVAKDRSFRHADSEDSDQTGRMPRLIWVFAGRTCHFVGFVMRWLIYPIEIKTNSEKGILWKQENLTRCTDPFHKFYTYRFVSCYYIK